MRVPNTFFGNGTVAALILYGMALIALFPGPPGANGFFQIERNVALTITSLGILATLLWWTVVRHKPVVTIRSYFFRRVIVVFTCAFAVLLWYGNLWLMGQFVAGNAAFENSWFNGLLVVVGTHQFIRGKIKMRQQWRTSSDVFESLRTAKVLMTRISRKYDYTFYAMVTLATIGVIHYFRVNDFTPYLCGALGALIFPYLCGVQISECLILKKLFPNDAELPAEVQL